MPDNKVIKHIKGRIKALLELYGNSMCSSKDHFRSTSTEVNIFKNGTWNETISIVHYIEAYFGTCPLLSPPLPPPPPSIITVYRYLKTVVRCFFQKQAKSVIVTTSSKSSSISDFKSNAVLYLETIFFSSLFILVT